MDVDRRDICRQFATHAASRGARPCAAACERAWRALSRCLLTLMVIAGVFSRSPARADELDDFEAARAVFEQHDFREAVARLSALLSSPQGPPQSSVIEREARKYLGVSYYLLGNSEQAKLQFELLLRLEPDYALDPVRFPAQVYETFAAVKEAVQQRSLAEAAERKKAPAEITLSETQASALRTWLDEDHGYWEVERRSRWMAFIPFGGGQWANGHMATGWLMAALSVGTATSATISGVLHQRLADETPTSGEIDSARSAERALRVVNWASLGALAVVAIAGIIDANVRFVPESRRFVRQPEPPVAKDLRDVLAQDAVDADSLTASAELGQP